AQPAAAAASLAAAQEIAVPSGRPPRAVASEYAERNGATLTSCTCEPGSSEAVVEVEAPVDLVFVGPDRTVRARARAVIEGAKRNVASTMAADAASQRTAAGPDQEGHARAGPAGSARRGGLHAGQASPAARVPPG